MIHFDTDGKMEKCDGCIERIREGREPACVSMFPGSNHDRKSKLRTVRAITLGNYCGIKMIDKRKADKER